MRKLLVLLSICAAVGACGDSSAPAVPAAIVLVGSSSQWGIAGEPVGDPLQIQIRDHNGASLRGIPFTVTVIGGGRITQGPPSATTIGTTVVGVWTLGGTIGPQSLLIRAGDLSLTINVDALPAAPAIATANGVSQTASGSVGGVSSVVPTIKVSDAFGNPIVGLVVSTVVTGGGSVQTPDATTNAAGVATVGTWTYGTESGTQSVSIIATHVSPVVFTATVNAGTAVGAVASGAVTGSGSIGIAAPIQPSIKVLDAFGNGVSNVAVTVSVSAGGSVQFANPSTNAQGIATTGAWTLSTTAGVNTVTMSAPGFAPVTFTVSAIRVPTSIVLAAGKFQMAAPGAALAVNPVFKVLDFIGNPLAGATVQFSTTVLPSAPTFGKGSVGVVSAVTDAQGQASPGAWTLGSALGSQTLQASAQGSTGSVVQTLYATALATGTSAYNLQVRYIDVPPAAVQAAFAAGAARVSQEITGHLSARVLTNFFVGSTVCFGASPPAGLPILNETISDLLLFVVIAPIDGPGGAVASTHICAIRDLVVDGNKLPVVAATVLDAADLDALVAAGTLNSVALHEMHHALGLGGSLWNIGLSLLFPVSLVPGNGGPNPLYLGAAANKAYVDAGGTSVDGIPVENTGVVGGPFRDIHWRESAFRSELFTSAPDAGIANPLSAITIMALADLGYAVSTASADPYTLPPGAGPGPAGSRLQSLLKKR